MGEQFLTEAIVKNGSGSPKAVRIGFEKNKPLVEALTDALKIKWDMRHELGWVMREVGGRRSNYYHFLITDKKTGKKYMPYVEVEDGEGEKKRVYLDLRNMLFNPDFMRDKVIEIFLVYDHRDIEGTIKTRYDGVHASFQLDEFTGADAGMSDFAKVMRKHYMESMQADYQFLFLQLRARTLADAAGKKSILSPVFTFGGFAFALPAPERNIMREAQSVAPIDALSVPTATGSAWPETEACVGVAAEEAPAPIACVPVPSNGNAQATPAEVHPPVRQDAIAWLSAASIMRGRQQVKQAKTGCGAGTNHAKGKASTPSQERAGHENKKTVKKERRKNETARDDGRKNDGGGRTEKTAPVPFSALTDFKAVIFDLDGVIVDSEMVHPRTFERALEKYGVKIDNAHWKRAYTGIGSYAIFDDLVKKYSIREDARELVKRRNAIYLAEIKKNRLPVIEGFKEFRRALAQNGIREAVASGGHTNHVRESLRSAGMGKTKFISIEMVRKGKPSPEIFLRAARRIRAKPSECIVFEDSLSGVEAAARAGMPCVALSTTMTARELRGRAALIVKNYKSKKLKGLLALLLARKKAARASGRRR